MAIGRILNKRDLVNNNFLSDDLGKEKQIMPYIYLGKGKISLSVHTCWGHFGPVVYFHSIAFLGWRSGLCYRIGFPFVFIR